MEETSLTSSKNLSSQQHEIGSEVTSLNIYCLRNLLHYLPWKDRLMVAGVSKLWKEAVISTLTPLKIIKCISSADIELLENCRSIRKISIKDTEASSVKFKKNFESLLRNNPEVEHIEINACFISILQTESLFHLSKLRHLSLSIDQVLFEDEMGHLTRLGELENLSTLKLVLKCNRTDVSVLRNIKNLTELDITCHDTIYSVSLVNSIHSLFHWNKNLKVLKRKFLGVSFDHYMSVCYDTERESAWLSKYERFK